MWRIYRYGVKAAVAWQVIYQIIRRYHDRLDLRIYELHPCSGQYDCLSLHSDTGVGCGKHLFDMNLVSGNLHFWSATNNGPLGKFAEDEGGLVGRYLSAHDPKEVIDVIARTIGMPTGPGVKVPPSNPKSIIAGIIADIFQRTCLSKEQVYVRAVVYDSSLYCGFRDEAKVFKEIQWLLDTENHKRGQQYWMILREDEERPRAIALLDFGGRVWFANAPDNEWNVFMKYLNNGHRLDLIVNRIMECVYGANS